MVDISTVRILEGPGLNIAYSRAYLRECVDHIPILIRTLIPASSHRSLYNLIASVELLNREQDQNEFFGEKLLGDATMRSVSPSNSPTLYRIPQKTVNRKSESNLASINSCTNHCVSTIWLGPFSNITGKPKNVAGSRVSRVAVLL